MRFIGWKWSWDVSQKVWPGPGPSPAIPPPCATFRFHRKGGGRLFLPLHTKGHSQFWKESVLVHWGLKSR